MGTVFEAEHLTVGHAVAVKVLHPNQARKKDAVRRFHQEARAAAAIGHPNICVVSDLGTLEDGSPYLVMERLVGETLAERIATHGGLPFGEVVQILGQVLSGLAAAHEKGIVHRDIKPENVFLTKQLNDHPPLAKLLDFGVSKMISSPLGEEKVGESEDLDLTRTGMVMGTPYYMAPEQARGDRDLDARVDLYACGVILYEALTSRRPFTAANYNALLLKILSSTPRPARELRPALPSGFDEVIQKAMQRSREDRYRTAGEFQGDLRALRDRRHGGTPVGAMGEAAAVEARAEGLEPTEASVEIPIAFSSDAQLPAEDAEPTEIGPIDRPEPTDDEPTRRMALHDPEEHPKERPEKPE
jgi:eukaryotic-like serine/threonine-protein kinase